MYLIALWRKYRGWVNFTLKSSELHGQMNFDDERTGGFEFKPHEPLSDFLIQSNLYSCHISSNRGLQLIAAPSFVHSKNEPDIFRCSEYVSSGGGERRWRSMIGMICCIRLVVSCVWKLNGSSLAKGSPRIMTASAWAFVITCKRGNKISVSRKLKRNLIQIRIRPVSFLRNYTSLLSYEKGWNGYEVITITQIYILRGRSRCRRRHRCLSSLRTDECQSCHRTPQRMSWPTLDKSSSTIVLPRAYDISEISLRVYGKLQAEICVSQNTQGDLLFFFRPHLAC